MHCPFCSSRQSEVMETRDSEDLDSIRRRRSCLSCGRRFTTYERVENIHVTVLKKDGRREQFNREKLRGGIATACEKTTVPAEMVEKIVTCIQQELRAAGQVEVPSTQLGQMVARELKKIDKVAYIRFSSVFKRFVDIEDFENEVNDLKIV